MRSLCEIVSALPKGFVDSIYQCSDIGELNGMLIGATKNEKELINARIGNLNHLWP